MDYRQLQSKLDAIANEDDMQDGHNLELLKAVAKQFAEDVAMEDYTAIDYLLKDIPESQLRGYLSEIE